MACAALQRSSCTLLPFREARGLRPQFQRRGNTVRCAAPTVVLTREKGKNDKMHSALSAMGFTTIELPLIKHAAGPDRHLLPDLLREGKFDWVTITSPEAATVFLEGWVEAGRPEVPVAVVGGGTGEILKAAGVVPQMVASKALGRVFGTELPRKEGGTNRVLYPASVKAGTDLQNGLTTSGFEVQRISTYDTVGVTDVEPGLLEEARQAKVITFGSPSAVKAWVNLVGLEEANQKLSVCIGSTSARACQTLGLKHVYYPEAPGIEAWAQCVQQAVTENHLAVEC